eukprot:15233467-Alexandrium_andersonii.AAC.1
MPKTDGGGRLADDARRENGRAVDAVQLGLLRGAVALRVVLALGGRGRAVAARLGDVESAVAVLPPDLSAE